MREACGWGENGFEGIKGARMLRYVHDNVKEQLKGARCTKTSYVHSRKIYLQNREEGKQRDKGQEEVHKIASELLDRLLQFGRKRNIQRVRLEEN